MTYKIKTGDTLSSIAKKHNTTVAALVAANGIKDPNRIRAGDVLAIPTDQADANRIYNALVTCLDAIEDLPEFKQLEALLNGRI